MHTCTCHKPVEFMHIMHWNAVIARMLEGKILFGRKKLIKKLIRSEIIKFKVIVMTHQQVTK